MHGHAEAVRSEAPLPKEAPPPHGAVRLRQALDVLTPHGYSRTADMGSVHAARVQNLRWRLSTPGRQRRRSAVPPCVQALAEDHLGDAAAPVLRPLQHQVPRLRGILKRVELEQSASECQVQPAWERMWRPAKVVRFHERLATEVPLIMPPGICLKEVPRRRSGESKVSKVPFNPYARPTCSVGTRRGEERSRANLARIMANHSQMKSSCFDSVGCFALLKSMFLSIALAPSDIMPNVCKGSA
eukprot:CAMPEP_0171211396 /NCGR_PEP_ID=MMETSP0790-20130122/29602_1 /TAXON_ID=2925 /ORGANISM="Alexandrium catenella, Strain OF101" /LENGTH=242 /DNA_ID=CAMNT_0011677061 /DNA_START=62 /DNA_END=791 /DNA_ORIENTATION=+